jgi:NTP pyrophosphatase (non-canonical NTP hydrolase)
MAQSLNVFARICTANAMLRGFHEDEEFIRQCVDHGLFENASLYDEGPPAQTWMDQHLAWFDSAVLQAELARQMSEIGEAVEAVRKPGPDHHCPEFSNFLIEEADVLIRVGDTVGKRGLDLGEAVVAKLLYNVSRPYKHGKES